MITTRFAPSPTGALHLGHALSALMAYDEARQSGGRFLLRIEDIDPVRCKPPFTLQIMEDLTWLGLAWEEPVRLQAAHMADYVEAFALLRAQGLVYPCFCTRHALLAESSASLTAPHETGVALYPGTCRSLSIDQRECLIAAETPHCWRLDMQKACALAPNLSWTDRLQGPVTAHPENFGDVVLARKDCPTSYHLSVTVDDALQGVSLVIRGEDLFPVTDIHRLLQALLGLPTPLYHHHRLLCGPDGKRLAKRDKAETLQALRAAGRTPEDVRRLVGL